MTYETNITLDLSGEQYNPPVTAMQGDKDSRYIIATLTAQGQPYTIPAGATARISVMKPHGECVLNDAEIEGNSVKILLTEQILIDFGIARAEVILFQGDKALSSAVFDLVIQEAAYDRDAIESTPEYQTFVDALAQMQGLTEDVEEVVENAATQAAYAKTQGDYAKAQGDAAKTQAASAKTQASAAQTAAGKANTAATSANSAATSANNAANRANTAADRCESLDVTALDNKISQLSSTLLDENGTLDLDVMPVGTMWTWWSDTLPSDKWVFGNTAIPTTCTKARQIWGTKTPDTAGRVVVDKSSDTEFNTIGKTGGKISSELYAAIGATNGDIASIGYSGRKKIDGLDSYTYAIRVGENAPTEPVNHSTVVLHPDGTEPSRLQPYIVSRYIFKIK